MSYAIVRNEKLTRAEAQGRCVHNDRKAKKHTNKEIDTERTHLNQYLKKNELNYVKEFDRLKKENNLQGHIRSNSIIMCEMIFTSDKEFFDKIGIEETKRYFEESYNFITNYKNLGEKNIISAVIHYDEGVPHMHLVYIPVVHTKDKEEKEIQKICARDFWKGRDSYRQLQNSYFEYVTSKGFMLERGELSEITGAENLKIEVLKQVTNYENTKKILQETTLEMPKTADLEEYNKVIFKRNEKIQKDIIEPRDNLIKQLYSENVNLHKELSKKANIMDKAEKLEKEYTSIISNNQELQEKCDQMENEFDKKVEQIEDKYNIQANSLQIQFSNETAKLKSDYESQIYQIERKEKKKYNELEKENRFLHRIIHTLQNTIDRVFSWVSHKFVEKDKEELKTEFEYDTYTSLDIEKQMARLDREKEDELVM